MFQQISGKAFTKLLLIASVVTAGIIGASFYLSSSSIHQLLTENKSLNKAISNLTTESQIGYATLQSQARDTEGKLHSSIRFVQTAADNPQQIVSEQIFTIEGDIAHFDALIVKFSDAYVQSGKGKALYLWRRIYGEQTSPANGALIEVPQTAPERYYSITKALRIKNRDIFWEAIWDLANAPESLSPYGIKAVFGNAIYTQLQANRIYYFKISPTGQIYIEVADRG